MKHPDLMKMEDLVQALREWMEDRWSEDPPVEIVNFASAYAEACEKVNDRLQICTDILAKGADKEHQALMAATRQPDLLDACAILSELQTEQYEALCRMHHLPRAVRLNERAKQAIDPLYQRAGSFQKRLRMEFSAANSKRDFRRALEIARQLAKGDPSVQRQAENLENRLIREVLETRIRPALDKGDEEEAVKALEDIEAIAPGRKPRPDERTEADWCEAIEIRKSLEKEAAIRDSAKLLGDAEAGREADNLERVVELLARIAASMEEHDFRLSSEKQQLFEELGDWRDKEVEKARQEQLFQTALDELRTLLKKITNKDFQNTVPGYEENREDALSLQRLWKNISEFKKSVPEELQTEARRTLGELTEKIDRHKSAKRRNLIVISAISAVVMTAIFITTAMWIKAADLASKLSSAQEDGRAAELQTFLKNLDESPPIWADFPSVVRARGNATTWLEAEAASRARLQGVLSSIRTELQASPESNQLTPVSLGAAKQRLDELEAEIEQVNPNYRTSLQDSLTSIRLEWSRITETKRNELVDAFHRQVQELDELATRELDKDRTAGELTDSFIKIGALIAEMDQVADIELEELKPGISDLTKFDLLKERFAKFEGEVKEFEAIMQKCASAGDVESYLMALKPLREIEFIAGSQKVALGKLIAAIDSKDRFFREILMPDDLLGWRRLTEREFSTHPKDITDEEISIILSLRDDASISEMYTYDINEVGGPRRIYVRGGTLEKATKRERGVLTEGMRGDEVYDPEGGSLSTVEFKSKSYLRLSSPGNQQGVLPTGEMLSPESEFFNSLALGDYVNEDFTGYRKSFCLFLQDIINGPEKVNPLFRAYLFIEVGSLMQERPEKWLIQFSDLESDLAEIRGIAGSLQSHDWCSSVKTKKVAKQINDFFAARRGNANYLNEAQAVHGFYARLLTGDLIYCGYLDHQNSAQLNEPTGSARRLWGMDKSLKATELFRRSASGEWEATRPAASYSPLFFLRVDPVLTWTSVTEQYRVDPSDPRLLKRLPATLGVTAGE